MRVRRCRQPVTPLFSRLRAVLSSEYLRQLTISSAVGLEYQDNAEGYRAAAAAATAAAPPPEEWSEAQLPPFPDAAAAEVAATLCELQALLRGDSGVVTPATLAAAHATLETQILPALAEMQRAAAAGAAGAAGGAAAGLSAGQAAAAALLAKYPNGLSAEGGDAPTDLAATVLRMLYIKDLRGLQVGAAGPGGEGCGAGPQQPSQRGVGPQELS